MRPRVLSGIQPTADSFHLGNYLGAARRRVVLERDPLAHRAEIVAEVERVSGRLDAGKNARAHGSQPNQGQTTFFLLKKILPPRADSFLQLLARLRQDRKSTRLNSSHT